MNIKNNQIKSDARQDTEQLFKTKTQQFAPQQELAENKIPKLYRRRTLIIFGCMFLLLLIWAYLCRGCIGISDTHSLGFGGGSSDFGTGPGSGNSGDGPGAGESGSNKGKFNEAKGKAGIGKDSSAPGTANPSMGSVAIDGAPSVPADKILTQIPLHVESIARTVAPAKPIQIAAKPQTGGSPQGRKGFYGVTVNENAKVLFIVDCSGSMGSSSNEIPGKTRLEVMIMELEKAIFNKQRSRYSSGAFAIVKFSDGAEQFPPRKKGLCYYSSEKRLKEAKEFTAYITSGGSTNMKTAWST
ncbi:MAG: VWA domain-containing protein, partial [Lentisphaeria bacterium]|nr:VWA domain-containing protein [Lentisphaeria bacterium]